MKVGYARESSKQTAVDQAYDYQIRRLQEYGCDRVFGDRMSGRRDSRKEYRQVVELIAAGQVNELVVTHLFRLGRSIIEIQRTVRLLLDKKVKLTILGGSVDLSTPEGRAFFNTQSVWAEYEADLGAERARIGWENAIKQRRSRTTLFGYVLVNGVYTPDIEIQEWGGSRWEVARQIIDNMLSGKITSMAGLVRWINALPWIENEKRRSRPPGTVAGLKDWMFNPILQGHSHFADRSIEVRDTHPALLSAAELHKLEEQIRFNKRYHGFKAQPILNPYAGLTRCAVCGGAYVIGRARQYFYYRCNYRRDGRCTNGKRVQVKTIDQAVYAAIGAAAKSIALVLAEPDNESIDLPPDVVALQAQIRALQAIPGSDEAIRMLIADKERELQNKLAQLQPSAIERVSEEEIQLFMRLAEPAFLDGLTPQDKGEVLRGIVQRIVIDPKGDVTVELLPRFAAVVD